MYEYVKGKLTKLKPNHAIVEIAGVGYTLDIPLNTYSTLSEKLGENILLFTSFVVREDSQRLFGFHGETERDLFNQVKEVSGIGPKTALALIGHLDQIDLQIAITNSNVKLISKVPGIGKKTAERLIIEMRDKLTKKPLDSITLLEAHQSNVANDALNALTHLGYNINQAQTAVKKALNSLPEKTPLPDLITHALKNV